jgi:hypothetical protein
MLRFPIQDIDPLLKDIARWIVFHQDCSFQFVRSHFKLDTRRVNSIYKQLVYAGILNYDYEYDEYDLIISSDEELDNIFFKIFNSRVVIWRTGLTHDKPSKEYFPWN